MQTIRNRKIIQYAFVSALLLFKTSIASSQTEGNDIVVLKSGKAHQGTIIEQRPGHFLKLLQTPSNDTLKLPYSEIETLKVIRNMETERITNDSGASQVNLDQTKFNNRPYYMILSGSLNGGDWANVGLGVGLLRTFTPRIQAGIGSTYQGALGNSVRFNSIPVLGLFKYALQESEKNRTAIIASLSAGYNFYLNSTAFEESVETYISNGIYLNPSIGYRINFTKNTGLIIDIGYQYLGGKKRRLSNDEFIKKNHLSSVSLKGTLFF